MPITGRVLTRKMGAAMASVVLWVEMSASLDVLLLVRKRDCSRLWSDDGSSIVRTNRYELARSTCTCSIEFFLLVLSVDLQSDKTFTRRF